MKDGKEGWDIILTFNGSSIRFTAEGDIIINAKRHIISQRRLSFDNCSPALVSNLIEAYSLGEKEYEQTLREYEENLTNELDIEVLELEECKIDLEGSFYKV